MNVLRINNVYIFEQLLFLFLFHLLYFVNLSFLSMSDMKTSGEPYFSTNSLSVIVSGKRSPVQLPTLISYPCYLKYHRSDDTITATTITHSDKKVVVSHYPCSEEAEESSEVVLR